MLPRVPATVDEIADVLRAGPFNMDQLRKMQAEARADIESVRSTGALPPEKLARFNAKFADRGGMTFPPPDVMLANMQRVLDAIERLIRERAN